MSGDLPRRIADRASRVGAPIDDALAGKLADYLELLARWNRTINLTALAVDPPGDEAIDRLVVESIVASRHVRADETRVLDVGSGGGSPAIPLKLAVPRLHFVLVESRSRKAAFLREAARQLSLDHVSVENRRLEDVALSPAADVVTMRAVRADAALMASVTQLARPDGRLLMFASSATARPPGVETVPLVPERQSVLLMWTVGDKKSRPGGTGPSVRDSSSV